jgi:hypothetical protein
VQGILGKEISNCKIDLTLQQICTPYYQNILDHHSSKYAFRLETIEVQEIKESSLNDGKEIILTFTLSLSPLDVSTTNLVSVAE